MRDDRTMETLVRQAIAGNVGAFVLLARHFQNQAFATAMATLQDKEAAEDATQEALLAAWSGLGSLAEPVAFPSWLRAIARRQALRLRRRKRLELVPLAQAEAVIDEAGSPAEQAMAHQDETLVQSWLAALPLSLREPALLFYVHDCSQQDIAAFLGLPLTTVNNRLHAVRRRLKQRRLIVVQETLKPGALGDEFASRIGRLLSSGKGHADILFDPSAMPDLLTELSISDERGRRLVTAQVARRLPNGVARAVLSDPATAFDRGATVMSARRHVAGPVAAEGLAAFLSDIAGPGSDRMIETGIKVVDLLCPIPEGGVVAIVGEPGTGITVVMEELARRLSDLGKPATLIVMMPPDLRWGEAKEEDFSYAQALRDEGFSEGSQGEVQSYFLRAPRPDWNDEALARFDRVDALICLSRELARAGIWPAVDPVRSRSRLIEEGRLDAAHLKIAREMRAALSAAAGADDRAGRLRAYVAQPFFVAEPWSGQPGVSVPLEELLAGCRRLLDAEGGLSGA